MTFEEIVAERPDFGFAFYAYKPGDPVTLEIHAPGGDIFTFHGRDMADVLEQAFGPFPDREPERAPEQEPAEEAASVFD